MRPSGRPEPLPGGLSGARLWAFETPAGRLVVRAWPTGMTPEQLARIHAWLEEVRVLPFVATPLRDLGGATFRRLPDRCWELMPWLPGTPGLIDRPDSHKLAAAGTGLAAFHSRLAAQVRDGPSPGMARRVEELTQLLLGGLDRLDQALQRRPPTLLAQQARDWLFSSRTTAETLLGEAKLAAAQPVPLQPCLRDARPDHFLFLGHELTGLIDFGAMEVDCVALDFARLLGEIRGLDRDGRCVFLAAYQNVRALEPQALRMIDQVMKVSKFLVTARWLAWHYLENKPIANEDVVQERLRGRVE
ncbi:MAG: aminoglycoside phosphotransferase family protein [Isosphaeraceae bacterium]